MHGPHVGLGGGRWDAEGTTRTVDGGSAARPEESETVLAAQTRLVGDPLALGRALEQLPAATVVPDHHTLSESGDRSLYVSVYGVEGDLFERALSLDPTVVVAERIEAFPDRLLYRIRLAEEAILVAPTSLELGCRTLAVKGTEGRWHARMQFPDRDALIALRQFCNDNDITFGLDSLTETARFAEPSLELTDTQRDTLRTAYEAGYFDIPRGTSQSELAAEFDVSTSAVSHRIRRATARLIRESLLDRGV